MDPHLLRKIRAPLKPVIAAQRLNPTQVRIVLECGHSEIRDIGDNDRLIPVEASCELCLSEHQLTEPIS
jgi:hypothetical protein